MKKVKITLVVVAVLVLVSAVNASADWYQCQITNVTPKPSGTVSMKFIPGEGETRFTGTARANIDPTDIGAKNMFATVLTAISLNKGVVLSLPSIPTYDYQVVDAVSLDAQ